MHRGILATLLSTFACHAMAGDLALDVRDAGGKPVAEAVLYALPTNGTAPAAPAATRALIDQLNKEFGPGARGYSFQLQVPPQRPGRNPKIVARKDLRR